MRHRLSILIVAALAAATVLASAAPAAFATTWDVQKPLNTPAGQIKTSNGTTFTVFDKSGAKVGRVIKTKPGNWKVVRGSTQVGVAKANGNKAFPVNLYDMKGKRIGRCGKMDGAWSMVRFSGIMNVRFGKAPQDCPARAAMGAARLLLWN